MTNTPRTDQLEDCDFHKYDADEVPLRVYRRMTEQARELERELADQAAMVDQLKAALDKALEENLAMRKPACNPPQA